MKKRVLSLILTVALLLGLFPAPAFAQGEEAHVHSYADGSCACGETEPAPQPETEHSHSGGTPTCSAQAVCDSCGQSYGNLTEHSYADGTCSVCGTADPNHVAQPQSDPEPEPEAVEPEDGEPEPSAEPCQHSGGSATCTEKAVCGVCGERYGDLAAHVFENGVCTLCGTSDLNYAASQSGPEKDPEVEAVRALLAALPTVAQLEAMDAAQQDAAIESIYAADDAFWNLSEQQQAELEEEYYAVMESIGQWLNQDRTSYADSGNCGDGVAWSISSQTFGTLTSTWLNISYTGSGSGKMTDYSSTNPAPWSGRDISYVNIYPGVKHIGAYAFYNCTSLGKENAQSPGFGLPSGIQFPQGSSVESIGAYAFYGCNQILSVDIPTSVKTIGDQAFNAGNTKMAVKVSCTLESLGSSVFTPGAIVNVVTGTYAETYCKENRINRTTRNHNFNNSGVCGDCGKTVEAKINETDTYYATLKEALGAAGSGQTVTLLKDRYTVAANENFTVKSGVTLEIPAGKTLDISVASNPNAAINVQGEFSVKGTLICPHRYSDNPAGWCSVCHINAQAERSGTYYVTLAEAMAAASSGDTITLLQNYTAGKDETFTVSSGITLAIAMDVTLDLTPMTDPQNQINISGSIDTTPGGTLKCPHKVDSNGKCVVCGVQAAASVTHNGITTYYASLTEAVNQANSLSSYSQNATVALLKDSTEPITISGSGVVLDLNGKNLTASGTVITVEGMSASARILVSEGGGTVTSCIYGTAIYGGEGYIQLTIAGGTFVGGTALSSTFYGGTVTITGGNFQGTVSATGMYSFKISGGTFTYIQANWLSSVSVDAYLADGCFYYDANGDRITDASTLGEKFISNVTVAGDHYHRLSYSLSGSTI